jgi:hypothetical protein
MELSTWSIVGGVMENDYLTLKQTLKNKSGTNQGFTLLQVCGFLKTATAT